MHGRELPEWLPDPRWLCPPFQPDDPRVIPDVDETLRGLVRREALNGSGVDVAFDAPTREWVARRSGPTVSMYLYDIREDLARREVQWEEVRGADGVVTDRRPPARRFKLTYMVTAWTQRPEDEHRLLSNLLTCFIRHERMGPEQLSGALADQPLPLFITTALPLGSDRSIADVWSALGGELKPSLDLVVTTPFVDARRQEAGKPVLEDPQFAFVPAPNGRGPSASAAGPSAAGGSGAAVAAETAGDGGGTDGADAHAGARGKGSARSRGGAGPEGAGKSGESGGERAESAAGGGSSEAGRGRSSLGLVGGIPLGAEETVHRGTKALPGRIVRVRPIPRRP